MNISKADFVASIVVSVVVGFGLGILGGVTAVKKYYKDQCEEELAATREVYENRMADVPEACQKRYTTETPDDEIEDAAPVTSYRRESRDYSKYYRKDEPEEKEDDVVEEIANPKPDHNDPPRVVSKDEALSSDVSCKELEYHIMDEALIDPNTPGQADLIDEVDAFGMIGNLLRVPDPTKLPNTVYVYNPGYDEYYEIYVYDDYWDPPEVDYEGPSFEKIRKRRFDE